MEKVKETGKKLNELRDFLEDIFLTKEEYILLKETTVKIIIELSKGFEITFVSNPHVNIQIRPLSIMELV